jgi:ubiquinone/menaquinone biosynthesis C-methylase UbiE
LKFDIVLLVVKNVEFETQKLKGYFAFDQLRNFILEKSFQYGYGENNLNQRSLLNWHRYERIVGKILTCSDGSVLDVGCGFGQITEMLHRKRRQVMGIDIGGEVRENKVWKHLQAPFVLGDGCILPLRSNFFDVVLCCGVLEHSYNKLQFLKECCRVTKNNGLFLCFFLPNKTGMESMFSGLIKTDHVFYDRGNIVSLFNECGWQVLVSKREHVMPSLYFLKGLQKLENRLGRTTLMLDDLLNKTPVNLFGNDWRVFAVKR